MDICELVKEFTTYEWLCLTHQEARRANGWTVKKIGEVDGLCADCETERQNGTQVTKERRP